MVRLVTYAKGGPAEAGNARTARRNAASNERKRIAGSLAAVQPRMMRCCVAPRNATFARIATETSVSIATAVLFPAYCANTSTMPTPVVPPTPLTIAV